MDNSEDELGSEEESIEIVKKRWDELKEKAKKDFEVVNSANQQKVNQTKLKIAQYVKGAVSYLRRDLPEVDAESDNLKDNKEVKKLGSEETRVALQNALSELQEKTNAIIMKANADFQKTVDEVKVKISKSVNNQIEIQKKIADTSTPQLNAGKMLEEQLENLKGSIKNSFDQANKESQKIVEEAKLKIAQSIQDINEKNQNRLGETTGSSNKTLTQLQEKAKQNFQEVQDKSDRMVELAKEDIARRIEDIKNEANKSKL